MAVLLAVRPLRLRFDATNLAVDEYEATICAFSGDPAYRTHPRRCPAHFDVAPGDDEAIFVDGFDG